MLWIWFGITVAAVLLELMTPSALICIWFAAGGAAAYLACWLKASLWIQFAVFFVISLIAVILSRPLAKKLMRGNTIATNADRVIGEQAIVTKEITPHKWGEVKVRGTYWHAVSDTGDVIEVDALVKVISIEGAKLIVRKTMK